MGHSIGAISLGVVAPSGRLTSVPLAIEIHDGMIRTHRGQKSKVEKMASLACKLSDWAGHPAIIVGDAYYATKNMAGNLSQQDRHLVTRVKSNAVAYLPAQAPRDAKRRGRPRLKGEKLTLNSLFGGMEPPGTRCDG